MDARCRGAAVHSLARQFNAFVQLTHLAGNSECGARVQQHDILLRGASSRQRRIEHRDVAFRICPITPVDAQEMIDELKAVKLLRGARGGIHASEEAIVDTLLKVGGEDGMMLALEGKVTEIDINPLIVSENEAIAVDARFVLKQD